MDSKSSLAVLILAAGASTRLGQSKQLVKVQNKALVHWQCELALHVFDNVICVLGCQSSAVAAEIGQLSVKTVVNKNWQQGMGSSIAAGIASLDEQINAVMIILVDQWLLDENDLSRVVETHYQHPDSIIVSAYTDSQNASKGPPVIFPRQFFSELEQLNSEQGAKPIIQNNAHRVVKCYVPNGRADLDQPEQLQQLEREFRRK